MRRHRFACRREFEPVICVYHTVGVGGRAALRGFAKMDRAKFRWISGKKRSDVSEKLPAKILRRWNMVAKRRIIFIQKPMVVMVVNDLSGALFDLADIDQHSSNRI